MKKIVRMFRWGLAFIFGSSAVTALLVTFLLLVIMTIGSNSHPSGMTPPVSVIEHLVAFCGVSCFGGAVFFALLLFAGVCIPSDPSNSTT